MHTTVSKRRQTSVPAKICEKYNIQAGTRLEWVDTGFGVELIPIGQDPVASLSGSGKGENLAAGILADRKRDKCRE
jgi:bifunctional DNA-binding transcriptional regulator/antitoxin component of YhaV-PrlF toxin-antitoxin module